MTDEAVPPIDKLLDDWTASADNRSARERIYAVTTQLTDPTDVSTIAEQADCSPNTARDTLAWFDEMGIVRQVAENPALYRRNEAYFEFLRVDRLASTQTASELDALLAELRDQESVVAAQFDVEHPEDVTLDTTDPETLEVRSDRLSEWRSLRQRIQDIHRAKAKQDVQTTGQNDSLPA